MTSLGTSKSSFAGVSGGPTTTNWPANVPVRPSQAPVAPPRLPAHPCLARVPPNDYHDVAAHQIRFVLLQQFLNGPLHRWARDDEPQLAECGLQML